MIMESKIPTPTFTNFEKAIRLNTKAIFIESFGNPNCNLIDIEKVTETAHKH
jgi:O-acetylhomoserine (thiol)-lyase